MRWAWQAKAAAVEDEKQTVMPKEEGKYFLLGTTQQLLLLEWRQEKWACGLRDDGEEEC